MSEKGMCRTVTIGVIAYNEQGHLPALLHDIVMQSYPHELTDIILVDGGSRDKTKVIMQSFQAEYSDSFRSITVLDNPGRIQAAGWNVVLENYNSDVIIRVDAHSGIARDFIEKAMGCINSGESVCGGITEMVTADSTKWDSTMLKAEISLFGAGIAKFKRNPPVRSYVDTVSFPAYRKDVTDRVGLFNEGLIRTEDNEYHYRIRKAGYKICFDPAIRSHHSIRSSFRGMIMQKYSNGEWIGRTLLKCPMCLSWYHMVPGAFVAGVVAATAAAAEGRRLPAKALWCAYSLANLMMSAAAKPEQPTDACLPFIFLSLHTAYGAGTIRGIAGGLLNYIRQSTER